MLRHKALPSAQRVFRLAQRQLSSLPAQETSDPLLPAFDHTPAQYTGPSKEEVRHLRQTFLSPGEELTESCCRHHIYSMWLSPVAFI